MNWNAASFPGGLHSDFLKPVISIIIHFAHCHRMTDSIRFRVRHTKYNWTRTFFPACPKLRTVYSEIIDNNSGTSSLEELQRPQDISSACNSDYKSHNL